MVPKIAKKLQKTGLSNTIIHAVAYPWACFLYSAGGEWRRVKNTTKSHVLCVQMEGVETGWVMMNMKNVTQVVFFVFIWWALGKTDAEHGNHAYPGMVSMFGA